MIYNDNTSAEAWANSMKNMRRAKHVDVKYHFIRQCVNEGAIATEHVDSALNWSDALTKPLPLAALKLFREKIGLCRSDLLQAKSQAE